MTIPDILERIHSSIVGLEHETGEDVDKLLAEAAGEICRLRRECLHLRSKEIARLVITTRK